MPDEDCQEWEATPSGGFAPTKETEEASNAATDGNGPDEEDGHDDEQEEEDEHASVDAADDEPGWYVLFNSPEEGVYSAIQGGPEAWRLFEIGEISDAIFIGFGKGPEAEARARQEFAGLWGEREMNRDSKDNVNHGTNKKSRKGSAVKVPKEQEHYLIPREHWPNYPCNEHEGQGWEVVLGKKRGPWVQCIFVNAKDEEGRPYANEWRRKSDLIQLDEKAEDGDKDEQETALAEAWTLAASGGAKYVSTTTGEVVVPSNYAEAERSKHYEEWRKAMEEEMESHRKAGTWKLVPVTSMPAGRKPVGSTWVFALKRDSEGKIKRWKARLVAQGFSQIEGYDYYATFANTVSFDSIRLVLAYAAGQDYDLHTADVRTAYLNAELEDDLDIWMRQPKGFEQTGDHGELLICKLVKAIYGLKQGARRWIATLKKGLKEMGFICSESDPGVFTINRDGERMILLTYVDDLIMADNSENLRKDVMTMVHAKWETTDITELEWCLGIKLERNRAKRTIAMSQALYIKDTAARFEENALRTGIRTNTPCGDAIKSLEKGAPDSKETSEVIDHYRSLIGALLWVANISRPDVSFAVSTLSKFTACPEKAHMRAALRVLGYLEKTKDTILHFGDFTGHKMCGGTLKAPGELVCFTDSSWGDERPASGFACFYKGALISWASRRLKTTPLSSCESEYDAATNAANEVLYLQDMIEDVTGDGRHGATTIYCDNSAACQLTEDAMSGKRVKHVMRKLTYLREQSETGRITLKFISGEVNPADIFTKCLPSGRFVELRSMLINEELEKDGDRPNKEKEVEERTAMMQMGEMETQSRKILVLFSGPYDRPDGLKAFLADLGMEAVMVDNDAERGGSAQDDLMDDAFFRDILRRAQDGEFAATIAAPPCSTFSVARFFQKEGQTGPPPVRTRTHPNGIPGQPLIRIREVQRADKLIARTCDVLRAVVKTGGEFILENPADRGNPDNSYLFIHKDHAPLWILPEIKELQAEVKGTMITFPMCELGHASQKLTTLLVTPGLVEPLRFLGKLRCTHKTHHQVGGEQMDGKYTSAEAAQYPSNLNQLLAKAVAEVNQKTKDPSWILGWETRQDRGRKYKAAIVDPDLLF